MPLSADLQRYVQVVFNVYRFKFYHDFKNTQPHSIDIRPLVLLGQQLQHQQDVEPALEELLDLAEQLNTESGITGLEIQQQQIIEAEQPVEIEPVAIADTCVDAVASSEDSLIEETMAIFLEEAEEHLQTIDTFYSKMSHQIKVIIN